MGMHSNKQALQSALTPYAMQVILTVHSCEPAAGRRTLAIKRERY